ncbi:MAG: pyruvate, phosphate dikinase [Candidatus Limnocylindria bacterium]
MSTSRIHDFDAPPIGDADALTQLLGGKGANLVLMAGELDMPVPPGFTITTRACLEFLSEGWPGDLDAELRAHMDRLGDRAGRRFGEASDPLLVSVRSGAAVSMPGMMDTILDLGLNEASTRGLAAATGDEAFANDCLRRFREGYRQVIGATSVPPDPWEQLRAAIEAVFRSWNSDRASAYRRREGIPDELGTAVTVQAMVFGNRGPNSGSGVLFTRNPSTGEPTPYGDVMFDAQGEDVVAGGHEPQPIAALDARLPEVAAELRRHAATLERHYADLCDIEFTIEEGRLWLLQVRVGKRSPRAALRMAIDMADDEAFPLTREEAIRRVRHLLTDPPRFFVRPEGRPEPIATGLPASPGVASGRIVTTSDAAEKAGSSGEAVILVRAETSPDDVRGMACATGVLTALGGLASHAAVVARGWGIPAVVGAAAVHPSAQAVEIAGRVMGAGEEITIDGSTGEIFPGRLAGRVEIVPEAATLLAWADELGTGLDAGPDGLVGGEAVDDRATEAPDRSDVSPDDVLRALLIRGAVAADALADGLAADIEPVTAAIERLEAEKQVEERDGALRLAPDGKLQALALVAADRQRIGAERAVALLETFHALDQRMKEIVTAWQVREIAGEEAINDHADAGYDASVLARLGELHEDAAGWLAPAGDELPRFAAYARRLGRALTLARDGDHRFVASPRVDSYHGAWFELHEELIRLAGRRRSGEAAAGRA